MNLLDQIKRDHDNLRQMLEKLEAYECPRPRWQSGIIYHLQKCFDDTQALAATDLRRVGSFVSAKIAVDADRAHEIRATPETAYEETSTASGRPESPTRTAPDATCGIIAS